jgi:hypothetical protein
MFVLLCLGLLVPEIGCKSRKRGEATDTGPESTTAITVTPTTSTKKNFGISVTSAPKEKDPDAGLGGIARVWTEQERSNRLKQLVLAYHNYLDTYKKGPAKASDLAPFYEKDANITEALEKGWFKFFYNVTLAQMREGSSNTIIAYEAEPDRAGMRWIALADGSVKKVSQQEFEKMPKAGK